ncbi:MAG TPA: methyltransferase domain-containing protein [Nitrospiraceae bacterium]|nr:methyltransferase domain-containing protein [Nitrospiraceae bacterium]
MRHEVADALVHPKTGLSLKVGTVNVEADGEIKEGSLVEPSTNAVIPIRNFIPRFVESDAYNACFGMEWNLFRRTQFDRFNGTTISAKRFYAVTGWSPDELRGQRILEVGCGAGRFSQVMLDAGAEVWSFDYSSAVDACRANNGPHPKHSIFQADIYSPPFKADYFDKILCFGVLQYVPDPKPAFMSVIKFLRPEGKFVMDTYRKEQWPTRWASRLLWRPITKRMPQAMLFHMVKWYVPRWLPIDNALDDARFFLRFAKYIRGIVPCFNYKGIHPLTEDQLREWAILDTFNVLAPQYENTHNLDEVQSWFEEARLSDIQVEWGGNGIKGCGRKGALSTSPRSKRPGLHSAA